MAREHTRTYFLAKLARELELRGFTAVLRADPPSLRVGLPDTVLMSETVDCVPMPDGWCYRWSWGEVLVSTSAPSEAADRIAHILRPC
jgi:hypothetical protein